MKTNTHTKYTSILTLACAVFSTCSAFSQTPKAPQAPQAPQASPSSVTAIEEHDPFAVSGPLVAQSPFEEAPAETLDAQARVLFARGETDAAINLQKKAIEKAKRSLSKTTENLARYQGKPADNEYIVEKLNRIMIPRVDFEERTLVDMLDFIQSKSKELDTVELNPDKKGINIVIAPLPNNSYYVDEDGNRIPVPNNEETTIKTTFWTEARIIKNLQLRNIPLSAALKYICLSTESRFEIEEHAVVIYPSIKIIPRE